MNGAGLLDRFSEWLQLIIGLIAIGLLSYFIFRIIVVFLDFISQVKPTIGASIVAAMATVLVGLGGTLLTQYQIKKTPSRRITS